MPNPLLDRQASLLAYLTSGAAIFGDGRGAPLDSALRGIDPADVDRLRKSLALLSEKQP